VQDILDLTIPMSALGIWNLNEGIVGTAGCVSLVAARLRASLHGFIFSFISSLMGLQTQMAKVLGVKKIPTGNQV
jgi:hypothetical protein